MPASSSDRPVERRGRRERAIEASHLSGIVANDPGAAPAPVTVDHPGHGELLRPLAEYGRAVGG